MILSIVIIITIVLVQWTSPCSRSPSVPVDFVLDGKWKPRILGADKDLMVMSKLTVWRSLAKQQRSFKDKPHGDDDDDDDDDDDKDLKIRPCQGARSVIHWTTTAGCTLYN